MHICNHYKTFFEQNLFTIESLLTPLCEFPKGCLNPEELKRIETLTYLDQVYCAKQFGYSSIASPQPREEERISRSSIMRYIGFLSAYSQLKSSFDEVLGVYELMGKGCVGDVSRQSLVELLLPTQILNHHPDLVKRYTTLFDSFLKRAQETKEKATNQMIHFSKEAIFDLAMSEILSAKLDSFYNTPSYEERNILLDSKDEIVSILLRHIQDFAAWAYEKTLPLKEINEEMNRLFIFIFQESNKIAKKQATTDEELEKKYQKFCQHYSSLPDFKKIRLNTTMKTELDKQQKLHSYYIPNIERLQQQMISYFAHELDDQIQYIILLGNQFLASNEKRKAIREKVQYENEQKQKMALHRIEKQIGFQHASIEGPHPVETSQEQKSLPDTPPSTPPNTALDDAPSSPSSVSFEIDTSKIREIDSQTSISTPSTSFTSLSSFTPQFMTLYETAKKLLINEFALDAIQNSKNLLQSLLLEIKTTPSITKEEIKVHISELLKLLCLQNEQLLSALVLEQKAPKHLPEAYSLLTHSQKELLDNLENISKKSAISKQIVKIEKASMYTRSIYAHPHISTYSIELLQRGEKITNGTKEEKVTSLLEEVYTLIEITWSQYTSQLFSSLFQQKGKELPSTFSQLFSSKLLKRPQLLPSETSEREKSPIASPIQSPTFPHAGWKKNIYEKINLLKKRIEVSLNTNNTVRKNNAPSKESLFLKDSLRNLSHLAIKINRIGKTDSLHIPSLRAEELLTLAIEQLLLSICMQNKVLTPQSQDSEIHSHNLQHLLSLLKIEKEIKDLDQQTFLYDSRNLQLRIRYPFSLMRKSEKEIDILDTSLLLNQDTKLLASEKKGVIDRESAEKDGFSPYLSKKDKWEQKKQKDLENRLQKKLQAGLSIIEFLSERFL